MRFSTTLSSHKFSWLQKNQVWNTRFTRESTRKILASICECIMTLMNIPKKIRASEKIDSTREWRLPYVRAVLYYKYGAFCFVKSLPGTCDACFFLLGNLLTFNLFSFFLRLGASVDLVVLFWEKEASRNQYLVSLLYLLAISRNDGMNTCTWLWPIYSMPLESRWIVYFHLCKGVEVLQYYNMS